MNNCEPLKNITKYTFERCLLSKPYISNKGFTTIEILELKEVKKRVEWLLKELKISKICCVCNDGDDDEHCDYTYEKVRDIINKAFED